MIVPNKETIRIVDDIDVVVPQSNSLMTPFVLKEQRDWFEDEIKFIRKFLKPGMKVIDIGANYGLYTLCSAKKIENEGQLWAFEPTGSVAECLRESLKENTFKNVNLIQAGLSNRNGEAKLAINPNAELNSLNTPINDNSEFETIELKTLDSSMVEYNWHDIDFIKLDAEGEEVRILEGGHKFLAENSPVIMYELKHGEQINLSLINKFEEYGYSSYYLIPGPMMLTPFNTDIEMDSFQLNLFAMKDDAAKKMQCLELLSFDTDIDHFNDSIEKDLWIEAIKNKNYSKGLIGKWLKYIDSNQNNAIINLYLDALDLFSFSMKNENSSEIRLKALLKSYQITKDLVDNNAFSFPISIMYCRILFEIGKRAKAVILLGEMIGLLTKGEGISLALPFYPPLKRYEDIDGKESLGNWLFSALLEPFELKKAFSSYFSGKQSLNNLNSLKKMAFCSDEIDRRIELLQSM